MHPPAVGETADIGSFKTGDLNHSTFIVGHCNDAVAAARRRVDPAVVRSGIFDRALAEARQYYSIGLNIEEIKELLAVSIRKELASLRKERVFVKERLLEERSLEMSIDSTKRRLRDVKAFDWLNLESKDVEVQFGNRTVVDVHQIVDLKIFVNIKGNSGWVNFQHRVRLPKDAMLDKRQWGISDGLLTITLPKEEAIDAGYEGEGKRQRSALEAFKEEDIHEDSCRRRR